MAFRSTGGRVTVGVWELGPRGAETTVHGDAVGGTVAGHPVDLAAAPRGTDGESRGCAAVVVASPGSETPGRPRIGERAEGAA